MSKDYDYEKFLSDSSDDYPKYEDFLNIFSKLADEMKADTPEEKTDLSTADFWPAKDPQQPKGYNERED